MNYFEHMAKYIASGGSGAIALDFTEHGYIENGRVIADENLFDIVDNALDYGLPIHVTAKFKFDIDGETIALPLGLYGIVSGYQRTGDLIYLTASCTFPIISENRFVQTHYAIAFASNGCQFITHLAFVG